MLLCAALILLAAGSRRATRRWRTRPRRWIARGSARSLKQRVDVNAPQVDGMTALHWAAYHDDRESRSCWCAPAPT